ncbi:hypothetical protein ERICIV_02179 [Paenibacillus larvae subsp. larvae]|uniref:Uncharacterized protein n=5 Tax=root TaxID=1 RepID=A0A345AVH1_9CAUD|nr:hypothetical protein [Paenibacillus larvae]YP_010082293.1 hypothetical protein KMD18_gp39 [Paenibacillus phage Halcyone]YP_010082384.1 hypothetical protein KMD19_gp40 [Paenibacillus phage Scottie]YP_010082462.1 hypothetical protein KMD20_gp27 [Paenibacillus phage Unity]AXF40994.1 hypothetical protein HEATH_39 [Paenibacillus phage Heath]AVF26319.1 hypothetical protein ERICIII_02158 [Paenibacillus larvae subsp. larvae]AVF31096.1 hypothetical protein ERICIV_02179 [Paenibacillus larvae subsp. 
MSRWQRLAEMDLINLFPYIVGRIEGIVESPLADDNTKINEVKKILLALNEELNGRDTE